MVLHVVVGRLGEDDLGGEITDEGGDATQGLLLVEDLNIVDEALVVGGADDAGGRVALGGAEAGYFVVVIDGGAAVTVADGEDMQFVAGIAEGGEGAGHHEFDIIRVGPDGKSDFAFGHRKHLQKQL